MPEFPLFADRYQMFFGVVTPRRYVRIEVTDFIWSEGLFSTFGALAEYSQYIPLGALLP